MKKLFSLIAAFFLMAGETEAQIITNGDCVGANVNASFFETGSRLVMSSV